MVPKSWACLPEIVILPTQPTFLAACPTMIGVGYSNTVELDGCHSNWQACDLARPMVSGETIKPRGIPAFESFRVEQIHPHRPIYFNFSIPPFRRGASRFVHRFVASSTEPWLVDTRHKMLPRSKTGADSSAKSEMSLLVDHLKGLDSHS